MRQGTPNSDAELLDLLRITGPLGVSELSDAMEVTPTAVRQRLTRLLGRESIQREAIRNGRGRPKHRYSLTENGLRLTGSNFTDLAVALWSEVQHINDQNLRRDLLRRIARTLAASYAGQIDGKTTEERMRSLGELLLRRRIPVSVEQSSDGTVLTAHACPYPKLAEQDHSVCSMERMMFSELVGKNVELTQCRLDGDGDCRFQVD